MIGFMVKEMDMRELVILESFLKVEWLFEMVCFRRLEILLIFFGGI